MGKRFLSVEKIIICILSLICINPAAIAHSSDTIRVITDPNSKPMVFYNEEIGAFDGFEYEIMVAIAKELNKDLEIVPSNYDDYIENLKQGKGDIIMGGFIPSDEYLELAYTSSYLQFGLCLVVREDSSIRSVNDLVNKKVGFYEDQEVKNFLNDKIGGDYIYIKYDDYGYFDDLDQGRLDAFLYDFPFAFYEIKPYKGNLVIISNDLTSLSYNIALKKEDEELKNKIDKIMFKLGNNGCLDSLRRKWFEIIAKGDKADKGDNEEKGEIVSETLQMYVVQKEDQLSTIALKFKMSWQELYDINRKTIGNNPNLIYPGMRLVINKAFQPVSEIEAEKISVFIDSKPQGASVFIDNKEILGRVTPITETLPVGKINIMIKKQGYDTWYSPLEVSEENKIIFAPLRLAF